MRPLEFADLLRARPELKQFVSVTSRRHDAAGSQAQSTLSTLLFARSMGVGYVHSPFRSMGNEKEPRRAARIWERFLNIGQGETYLTPEHEAISLAAYLKSPDSFQRPVVITAKQFYPLAMELPDHYAGIRSLARRRYDAADKSRIKLHRQRGRLSVAVHVRRGKLAVTSMHRWSTDAPILRTIENLLETSPRDLTVNIYSEGDPADFEDYAKLGCRLHISTNVFATFHNLVAADVLVTARSCFSYVTGLLSKGIVIYEPWGFGETGPKHPTNPGWIVRKSDGAIPVDAVAARLAEARPPKASLWNRLNGSPAAVR